MLVGHSFSNADGTIVAIDQRVCEFLQRSRSSLIGASYLDITHPDDKTINQTKIATLAVGDVLLMRKRYLRPDGSSAPADMHVSRFETSTGDSRLIGSISSPHPTKDLRSPSMLWAAARRALHIVSLRKELLAGLHSDVAWEILLHVYLAEAEGHAVRSAELSAQIGQTRRITERWIDLLHHQGILELDPTNAGMPQMSAIGLRKIETILVA